MRLWSVRILYSDVGVECDIGLGQMGMMFTFTLVGYLVSRGRSVM